MNTFESEKLLNVFIFILKCIEKCDNIYKNKCSKGENEMEYILIYFAVISLITIIATVYDKKAAKSRPKHRVPEKILFLLAILGGSVAEYLTMLRIRHKTKHKRFMIGLPIIIALQVVILWLILTQEFNF